MSSGANFSYGMVFTGETSGFKAAAQEVKGELTSLKTFTMQWGDTTEKATGVGFRGLRSMIWGTQLLMMYGGFLYQNMIREELATMSLETAQQNYNEAVREYGVNSEQAINAAKMIERQQLLVARANQMAMLMTVSFGLQIAATTAEFLRQLPVLTLTISKYWALASAKVAASGWMAPVMAAAIGIGVGAIAGYSINQARQTNVTVNIDNQGNQDLHKAMAEAERKATYELRRGGG
jgi:hypothetical protein